MAPDPDTRSPAPSPSAPAPPATSEESVGAAPTSRRDDFASDEEHVRDVDPHPDTPDDFDDDASSPRESVEAVHDAGGDADDD
jgi:hypothetical protein